MSWAVAPIRALTYALRPVNQHQYWNLGCVTSVASRYSYTAATSARNVGCFFGHGRFVELRRSRLQLGGAQLNPSFLGNLYALQSNEEFVGATVVAYCARPPVPSSGRFREQVTCSL